MTSLVSAVWWNPFSWKKNVMYSEESSFENAISKMMDNPYFDETDNSEKNYGSEINNEKSVAEENTKENEKLSEGEDKGFISEEDYEQEYPEESQDEEEEIISEEEEEIQIEDEEDQESIFEGITDNQDKKTNNTEALEINNTENKTIKEDNLKNTKLKICKKIIAYWNGDNEFDFYNKRILNGSNIVLAKGLEGNSFKFLGKTNSYIILNNDFDLDKKFGISMWIKTTCKNCMIFSSSEKSDGINADTKNHGIFKLFIDNEGIPYFISKDKLKINKKITDNKWHNIIIIIENKKSILLYIDNILILNNSLKNDISEKNFKEIIFGQERIGKNRIFFTSKPYKYTNSYKGYIDGILIFNNSLSKQEISEVYKYKNYSCD